MRPLSASERRTVALGLLVLAVALIGLLVIGPLVAGFLSRADQRRDLQAAYARNERLMDSLPGLRAEAEAQRKTAPRFAVAAPSEAAAVEALKARMQRLSADLGFSIAAIEDLQADAAPGAVKIRADLTLTLTQLSETLRRLESEDTYVVVDYLSITADRSLAANRLAPVDARLEFSTDWRPTRNEPR